MSVFRESEIDPRDWTLGQKLRARRKAQAMSLQQVSEASKISVGGLSQIERGLSSPSIRDLRAICAALSMPISTLFDGDGPADADETGLIVRRRDRRFFDFGTKGMSKTLLVPDLDRKLQFLEVVMRPGGGSGEQLYNHHGEECGLILEGTMELTVDDKCYYLEPGDSFAFESMRPHGFRNPGQETVRVLWITTPPIY